MERPGTRTGHGTRLSEQILVVDGVPQNPCNTRACSSSSLISRTCLSGCVQLTANPLTLFMRALLPPRAPISSHIDSLTFFTHTHSLLSTLVNSHLVTTVSGNYLHIPPSLISFHPRRHHIQPSRFFRDNTATTRIRLSPSSFPKPPSWQQRIVAATRPGASSRPTSQTHPTVSRTAGRAS